MEEYTSKKLQELLGASVVTKTRPAKCSTSGGLQEFDVIDGSSSPSASSACRNSSATCNFKSKVGRSSHTFQVFSLTHQQQVIPERQRAFQCKITREDVNKNPNWPSLSYDKYVQLCAVVHINGKLNKGERCCSHLRQGPKCSWFSHLWLGSARLHEI